jgi:hypothetical protein
LAKRPRKSLARLREWDYSLMLHCRLRSLVGWGLFIVGNDIYLNNMGVCPRRVLRPRCAIIASLHQEQTNTRMDTIMLKAVPYRVRSRESRMAVSGVDRYSNSYDHAQLSCVPWMILLLLNRSALVAPTIAVPEGSTHPYTIEYAQVSQFCTCVEYQEFQTSLPS